MQCEYLMTSHNYLLSGMIVSSLGAMLGIITYCSTHDDRKINYKKDLSTGVKTTSITTYLPFVFIGLLPLWMTLDGLIVSLPFSNTQYFNFNPNPFVAAALATLGYPLLMSFTLCLSFHLGKRKFGVVSVLGASYLAIHAITALVPNESLIPTLTFYILNLLPILASDILLSSSANRWLSVYVSGLILGSSFLMMQYPLITYVYNEVFTKRVFVWPSCYSPAISG